MVARGLNPSPDGPIPYHKSNDALSSPALDGRDAKQIDLYPSQFQKYAVVEIFILVSSITSKTPRSTSLMACARLKPWPSRR